MNRSMPTGLPGPSSTRSIFGSRISRGRWSFPSSNLVMKVVPTTCSGGIP
jgi:hypothetical protein